MEAYQVETDYGRTIEAYSGKLARDGPPRTVDFLRAGRVALVYATLDGGETGYWDRGNREWEDPATRIRPAGETGAAGRPQAVPADLVRLPIAVAVAPDPADAKPALPTGPETIIRLPASSAPADAAPTEIAPEGPEVEGSVALVSARVPVAGAATTATASPPARAPATVEPAPPQVQKEAPKALDVAP